MSTTSKRGFTLIELLAVIVIAALIVLIAIPALKTISATALQSGARQVTNALQLTRQYAINRRQPIRFVLAVDAAAMGTSSSNLICRAFAIYYPSNDVNGITLAWRPLQDWRALPDGVVFSDLNSSSYNTINMPETPPLGSNTRTLGTAGSTLTAWQYYDSNVNMQLVTNLINGGSASINVSYVQFRPTGVADSAGGSGSAGGIRVMQGSVFDPGSRTLIINNTNNWVYIEYDLLAGRVRTRYSDSYR